MARPQHALGIRLPGDFYMKHMSYLWLAPGRGGRSERALEGIDDTPMHEAHSLAYSPFHAQINCSIGQWAKFLYRLKSIRVETPWGTVEGPRWSTNGQAPDKYIIDEVQIPQYPGVSFVAGTDLGPNPRNLVLHIGLVGDDITEGRPSSSNLRVIMSDIFHHGGFEVEDTGVEGWVSRRAALYTISGRVFPFIYLAIKKGNYDFEAPSTGRYFIEYPPLQQHVYDSNGKLRLFDWEGSITVTGNIDRNDLPQLHPDITVTAAEYYTYDDIWDPTTGEKLQPIVVY